MNFSDTPDEARFRAEARAWLDANAARRLPGDPPPDVFGEQVDATSLGEARVWQRCKAEGGWACLTWPAAYGGRDATPMEAVIWAQEEARYRTPPNVFSVGVGFCGPTILAHGTDAQRERWIPPLVRGEEIWCQLFSEPSAGSDLAGLRSTAVRDGDDWIVNGQKIWTTAAQIADWAILLARSDATLSKHAGLTFFVVDARSPGIEIRPITQINGGRGFNEVFLNDVRIPDANRISEVGNGWAVAMTTLMHERASVPPEAGFDVDELVALSRSTFVDGRPAIENAAVRQRLAEFSTRARAVALTGTRILSALSQGRSPGPEASLGKLVGGTLGQEIAAFAMDLQAELGASQDPAASPQAAEWQERYLAIPTMRLAGGTDEILRNVIAERVLGLPPEIRIDKGVPFRDLRTGS